jgi:beta-1,4-mannosyltransferase
MEHIKLLPTISLPRSKWGRRPGVAEGADAAPNCAPIVYLSPFHHETNQYLARFREQLQEAGCEVRSAHEVWKLQLLFSRNPRQRLVFLNWFEDRVLRHGSLKEWIVFYAKVLTLWLQPIDVVWVRHNYETQGQSAPKWISDGIYRLMNRISLITVVHSPTAASSMSCHYLPHPLYVTSNAVPPISFTASLPADLGGRVAMLGQLRRSKKVAETLEAWPTDIPLIAAGEPESTEYLQEIRAICGKRRLDIILIARSLSQAEFDHLMRSVRLVYIPNPDHTMIVSGVFFHAASLGTPVVMRQSRFAAEMASTWDFVEALEGLDELPEALKKLARVNRAAIMQCVTQRYGSEAFASDLQKLLAILQPHP